MISNFELLNKFKLISSRDEIPKVLNECNRNKIMCELGVQKGKYLHKLITNGNPELIFAIDIWERTDQNCFWDVDTQLKYYNQVIKYFTQPNCKIIKKDGSEAVKDFKDNYFDFIYIDCDHRYEYVKNDIKNWWPKVKLNGILAGHDYIKNDKKKWGVIEAVDEFISDNNISLFCVCAKNNWIIIKDS